MRSPPSGPHGHRRALPLKRGRRAGREGWWRVLGTLAAVSLLGACGRSPRAAVSGRPEVAALIATALPAVVRIHTRGGMAQGEGSGFFVRDAAGAALVVTCHHVVWGASEIAIERNDGVSEPAVLVGADPSTDLALVRPASRTAPANLSFGDDRAMQAGSWLVTLGSPDGLFNAASVGVLSARGLVPGGRRPAERLVDHLFVDTALGAGASGGPVIDLEGRVVGVRVAALGGSRALGVALPSGVAASVVRDLEQAAQSPHAYAGLEVVDEIDARVPRGSVRVTSVASAGPAAEADIRRDDHILALDGRPLQGASDLRLRLFTARPDGTVKLALWRARARLEVTVRLRPPPAVGL